MYSKEKIMECLYNGPFLIEGRAVSGKTTFLKECLTFLLTERLINYERLIVFTDKDEEIKSYLYQYLGKGFKELWINSFFSFGKIILRRYYNYFQGLSSNFQILDGLEERIVLRKVIDEIPLDYFVSPQQDTGLLDAVVDFIDTVKLKQLKEFPSDKKYGDLKKILHNYEAHLRKNNWVDFRDIILMSIKLFKQNLDILNNFREKFQYIFIDDFQDLDMNQYELFCLLAKDKKNVFMFGNDEQCLFRFRGANPEKIKERFISDFNPKRYSFTEKFVNPEVVVVGCESRTEESLFVVSHIKRLLDNGYNPKDIAILYRGISEEIKSLEDAFSIFGITDYVVEGGITFFKQPYTVGLLSLLYLIFGKDDDESKIYNLFKYKGSILSPPQLERVITYKEKNKISFLEAADKLYKLKLISTKEITYIKDTFLKIDRLKKLSTSISPEEMLKKIFIEFEYSKLVLEDSDLSIVLKHFLEIVRRFERIHKGKSFHYFMHYLNEIIISYGRMQLETQDSKNKIRVTSVQQAKGSLFPIVFVIGVEEGNFPREFSLPSLIINYPQLSFISDIDIHLNEERRIFNFALTRAINQLYLSFSYEKKRTEQRKPSPFLLEYFKIGSLEDLYKIGVKHFYGVPLFSTEKNITEKKVVLKTNSETIKLKKDISFSITSLEEFVKCPRLFFYRNILRIPVPQKPYLLWGSVVHNILAEFHKEFSTPKELHTSNAKKRLKEIISKIFLNWAKHFSTLYEKDVYQKLAEDTLFNYLSIEKKKSFKRILKTEFPIECRVNNCIISGRIDRIDEEENGFSIIDYKTGKSDFGFRSLINQIKETTHLQIPFYCSIIRKKLLLKKVYIYWLRKEKRVELDIESIKEEINSIENNIESIIERIQNGNFQKKKGSQCYNCDFKDFCGD